MHVFYIDNKKQTNDNFGFLAYFSVLNFQLQKETASQDLVASS